MKASTSNKTAHINDAVIGQAASKTSTMVQIAAAIGFSIALLSIVGFSSMEVAHNAAHDTRHAFVFPCH